MPVLSKAKDFSMMKVLNILKVAGNVIKQEVVCKFS